MDRSHQSPTPPPDQPAPNMKETDLNDTAPPDRDRIF